MSPKELLYIEDALGHEKNMMDYCNNFAVQIQDAELKNFVQNLSNKYQGNYNRLYGLLNNA